MATTRTEQLPEVFLRQLGLVAPEKLAALEVTLIGAGGIGSAVAVALAKMGIDKITVFDYDTVSEHNLSNQWFRVGDVGRPKVEALREIVREYSGVEITARAEKYEAQPLRGIVIAAVDKISTREMIWKRAEYNPLVDLFIDGRMGGEQYYVYAVRPCDPDDIKWYKDRLFPEEQAAELPCSERSIIYTLLGMAKDIAFIVKSFAKANVRPRQIVCDVPTGVFTMTPLT